MTLRLIFAILLTFHFLPAMVMAEEKSSTYATSPVTIDGKMTEWGINPRYFNSESGVLYEVKNDESQLYIIIKSNEPTTIKQMLIAGFSLRLTIKTNPPLICTMRHAGKNRNQLRVSNPSALADKSEMMTKLIADTMTTDGFRYADKIIIAGTADSSKIGFSRSRPNPETIVIEYRIPLKELYGNNTNLSQSIQFPFNLKVTLNEFLNGQSSGIHRPMGGMNGQRNGAMRGNGMGGGMHNNGMTGARYPGMTHELADDNGENANPNISEGGMRFVRKSFSVEFVLSPKP